MRTSRFAMLALAVAWCAVAFVVVGTAPLVDAARTIAGAGSAPSARVVAVLIVWLAATLFAVLAAIDAGWWLARRRARLAIHPPIIVLVVGAFLFVAGMAAHLDSYSVCCAPPVVSPR